MDEKTPNCRGIESIDRTEDDGRFRELRHTLFCYKVGICVARELCDAASRAATPGNLARIAELIGSDRWRQFDEAVVAAFRLG